MTDRDQELLKGTRWEGDPNITVRHGVIHDKRYDQRKETTMNETTYTRDQVNDALNQAADEVLGDPAYENSDVIRDQDLINLMVNLAMGFLDDPGKTADQVIEDSYSEDAETVRRWIS